MKKIQLKKRLIEIVESKRVIKESLSESKNPLIKDLDQKLSTEIYVFDAVIDSLNGSDVMLNTYFKKSEQN